MKYLIIQLSDASVSLCNYTASENDNLISLDDLKKGLIWGVKNGLSIQIVFPNFELPKSYLSLLTRFEHVNICSTKQSVENGILVIDDIDEFLSIHSVEVPVILHLTISEFLKRQKDIAENLYKFIRLNIIFTDIQNFSDELSEEYERALAMLSDKIFELYVREQPVQLNLITDGTMLTRMNNCNAGVDSITLAPDGNFYICPAFYLSSSSNCGSPEENVNIPNNHLYTLSFAPICRECDAFHCKRCIYQNKFFTYEINTPGHKQCTMSHIERNVSRILLEKIRDFGEYAPNVSIPPLEYNDPFYKIINKN